MDLNHRPQMRQDLLKNIWAIQSPRILIEEDEANVLIENRMLGQNWS